MKKTLSLILALLMLVGSVSSCSEGETETESSAADPSSEASVTESETEETVDPLSDGLPEKADFGGRDFIVLGYDQGQTKYIYTEEYNGESVNDAVYARNLSLQERFNAVIKVNLQADYVIAGQTIDTCAQSSDAEAFHLVSNHVVTSGGNAMKGNFMNWYDVPNVDFSKPWWADSTIEDLSMNNRCFLAAGDAAISTIGATYCVFFDKVLAEANGITGLYDTVREGKWTADYLMQLSEQVAKDLDGNGVMDSNDFYGFASGANSPVNLFLWALGGKVIDKNAEGEFEFSYYNEHLVDIFDKVYTLLKETDGVITDPDSTYGVKMMVQGNALFSNARFVYALTQLENYENEFGIIPPVKYDENQAEYRTMVDGSHEILAVAKNVALSDLEFIGTMTEALCAEAHKQILPAYYDVCLKQRYSDSPEDAEMIELCVESRVFDLGYVYDNWSGVSFIMQNMMKEGNKDIASHYQSIQNSKEEYYKSVIALFEAE